MTSTDPYVKIYLLYNEQRIAKKKTHVKKRTLNPVFNESFVFDLPNLEVQGGQAIRARDHPMLGDSEESLEIEQVAWFGHRFLSVRYCGENRG